jgi:dTDP-glucose 4,6-dehydratase
LLQIILERGTIGESYALGGNQELSNLELVEFICQLLDIHYPQQHSYLDLITYVKDRPGHDYRYAIDTSKIEKEFNWHPENHFQKHLLQTIHHYASLIKKSQIKILK